MFFTLETGFLTSETENFSFKENIYQNIILASTDFSVQNLIFFYFKNYILFFALEATFLFLLENCLT